MTGECETILALGKLEPGRYELEIAHADPMSAPVKGEGGCRIRLHDTYLSIWPSEQSKRPTDEVLEEAYSESIKSYPRPLTQLAREAGELISIKQEPELRHVLAHLIYAIEALANGNAGTAIYEVESIKSAVFWDSDGAMDADANAMFKETDDAEREELQGQEELPGQKELQTKRVTEGREEKVDLGPDGVTIQAFDERWGFLSHCKLIPEAYGGASPHHIKAEVYLDGPVRGWVNGQT